MTSEPAESGFADKVKHKAYPAREAGGFVWTYMGPAETMPEFEPPPFAPTPDTRVSIVKIRSRQLGADHRGAIDSAHSSSLHSSDMVPARVDGAKATDQTWLRPSTDKAPRLQVQRTSFGFRYAAIRRPIQNANTHDYVRTTVFVAPFISLIPPNNLYNVTTVLRADRRPQHRLLFHRLERARQARHRSGGLAQVQRRAGRDRRRRALPQQAHARQRLPAGPPGDEARQFHRHRGHSQPGHRDVGDHGAGISDRTKDRLGASDLAVVEFRRLMVEAARRMRDTGVAIGRTTPHIPHAKISSFEGIVPKATDWRTLGVAPEELALRGEQERVA